MKIINKIKSLDIIISFKKDESLYDVLVTEYFGINYFFRISLREHDTKKIINEQLKDKQVKEDIKDIDFSFKGFLSKEQARRIKKQLIEMRT